MRMPPRPKTNSSKASSWKPGQDIMWGDMMIAPDHPKYNEYASRLKAGAKPPGGMPLPPKRNATTDRSVPQSAETKSSTEKYWENFVKSGKVPAWVNDYPREWQRLEDRYMKPKGWENIPKEIAPNKSARSGLSEINKKFLQKNQNFPQSTTNTANPLDKLDKITQARDIHGNEIKTADMLVSGGVKLQQNQRAEKKPESKFQFRNIGGQVRIVGTTDPKATSEAELPQSMGQTQPKRPTATTKAKTRAGMR